MSGLILLSLRLTFCALVLHQTPLRAKFIVLVGIDYRLCWEKFGWSTEKADELLLPVLKEYNKREVDSSLSIDLFLLFIHLAVDFVSLQ